MEKIISELKGYTKEEIDGITVRFLSTLTRNDLVHILLDMIDPRVMLENIILTKERIDLTLVYTGNPLLACMECKELFYKLEKELNLIGIDTADLYMK